MSPEAQRIAILEAMGWSGPFQKEWLRDYGKEGEDVWAFCGTNPEGECAPAPDPTSDLNAMAEAEKVLNTVGVSNYADNLIQVIGGLNENTDTPNFEYFRIAHATAAQRCEAFLKTLGKWSAQSARDTGRRET